MRTYWLGIARGLSSLVALLLLVACGGGGGGGGGPAPVVYAGNTNAAAITPANASQLTANLFGNEDAASIILGVSTESSDATQNRGSGAMDLALRLNRTFREAVVRVEKARSAQQVARAAIPVNETVPCASGGSVHTSGTLNDNGTGTLSMSFNDCRIGDATLDGPATVRVDVFDLVFFVPTDFTVSFVRLTLRGPGVSVDVGGSLRAQLFPSMETITEDVVSLNNNTGRMTKTENLRFENIQNTPSSFTSTVSGRVFDQVHGYVDIATVTPLAFGTMGQLFPDSGQLVLTGAGSSIRATALSATMARLELDLDGIAGFEYIATLKWTDLSGPVGADLADNDGDGMHNSWETVNGLPLDVNVNDAALDKDGDGARNFSEYLAGTDPSDILSFPPAGDLSISSSDLPDPATVNVDLTYTITVFNPSVSAATNVVVADTLPASVSLVSATPSLGSCTGTTSLTCDLGTLPGFGIVVIAIVVTPNAQGAISNTANVTSSSTDPDLSNNSATSLTDIQ